MRLQEKIPNLWGCAFFNSAASRIASRESAYRYGVRTSGKVEWQWDNTDPFGNNMPNENPSGLGTFKQSLRYPGMVSDPETGLFQNHHREYDPALGRYPMSDPIGLDGGSFSTYIYAKNNPLLNIDPTGQDTVSSLTRIVPGLAPIAWPVAGYALFCTVADAKMTHDREEIAQGAWDVYNAAMQACADGVASACSDLPTLYDRALKMSANVGGTGSKLVPKK